MVSRLFPSGSRSIRIFHQIASIVMGLTRLDQAPVLRLAVNSINLRLLRSGESKASQPQSEAFCMTRSRKHDVALHEKNNRNASELLDGVIVS